MTEVHSPGAGAREQQQCQGSQASSGACARGGGRARRVTFCVHSILLISYLIYAYYTHTLITSALMTPADGSAHASFMTNWVPTGNTPVAKLGIVV